MSFIMLFLFVIALLYFSVIVCFTTGWILLDEPGKSTGLTTSVSLIIPARNEEAAIISCLEDIAVQDYPANLLEVIIVDDNSTDHTGRVVTDFIRLHQGIPLILIKIPDDQLQTGKKKAIEYAVSHSNGDLIITSDADTRFGPSRISAIAGYYEMSRPKMILAPVSFYHEDSFFSSIQSLEFLGLMGVTGGSSGIGWPVMCNGANLGYERKAFTAVGGYMDNFSYSSGDDAFLMGKIRKQFGAGSVKYLRSSDAIVLTKAQDSFNDFVQQRIRWVSKNKGMKDVRILSVAIITWLFNFSFLAGVIYGFFNPDFFYPLLIVLLGKMGIEFPLLFLTARWFGKTKLLVYYPVGQLLNIFYVVFIGFLGNFVPYTWKGRKGS
jgi:cellulose synthase/poly-beta-1,6-N-acetylglucosamine synthase-like glycosyltransferase